MKEWHAKHLETIIVKYVTGLADNAPMWEKRNNKKYGRISSVCKQLDYDIKHGATKEEALVILDRVRNHVSFSKLRKEDNAIQRLDELQEHFAPLKAFNYW